MATPKLRFKEFDDDWSESKLKDCIDSIDSGWSPQCESYPADENEWAVLKTTSVDWDGFKANFNKKLPSSLEARFEIEVKPSDILVTRAGPTERVGVVAVVPQNVRSKLMISDKLIRLKANSDNSPEFLGISLSSVKCQNQLQSKTSGLAKSQTNISQKILSDVSLMTPAKAEQIKIASFLSAVDEKISQLTQKHELLSQYKQGMMQKMFTQQLRFKADDGGEFGGWETKLIKDIADVKGGKRLPKGYSLINENTGHPYITVSDMNRSYSIDSTNIRYVPLEVVDTIKRYTITDKDIFISVAGTLGIIGKIPTEFNGANLTENADKLTNLKCHQEFLIYLLDSGYLSELIESTATTSAQPKLALYAIEQLEIQIPCLEEQTKIANFLSAIDQKIEVVAQQIEQAKQWKKGLLQQMFV